MLLMLAGATSFGQSKKEARAAAFERALKDTSFMFDLQAVASAASGGQSTLDPIYSFKVTPSLIVSDMPYFGSSRFPNGNFAKSPLRFESKQFSYMVNPTGKGWEVIIRFKDVHEVQGISFLIAKSGYGNMQVTPLDLQSIAFSGNVEPPKL